MPYRSSSPLRGARGVSRCVVVVAHRTTMGSSTALRSDPPGTAARDGIDLQDTPSLPVTRYRCVKGSKRWLNAQAGCLMPEQWLLSIVPGQPPLSRWMAQIESSGSLCAVANLPTLLASGRNVTSVFFG